MRCYVHPEAEAVGICVRCGRAVCLDCQQERHGRIVCRECEEASAGAWTGFKIEFPNFERMFDELFGRRCLKCGERIAPNFVVCPYCTAPLQPICSDCGEKLRPDWKACPYCGKRVEAPA